MIKRLAEKELRSLARQFKAVAVTGPRQSGKTTLTKFVFPNKPYQNLENPDTRSYALQDPRGFLHSMPHGGIIDEIQRVPELFSYLQQILDESKNPGKFILTGSNNFLLQENISQSLSGRVAYLVLLPFSYPEIKHQVRGLENLLYQGGYPPLYDQPVHPAEWLSNYLRTYVERDVRQLKNISNLILFERFIRLCAGRIGQLLNMTSLAIETGVDNKTISSWLSLLENSFILFRLSPHFRNFHKRLVKMPKIYFYDTGLVCSLLGIKEVSQLSSHPLAGSIFENFVITEAVKFFHHHGKPDRLYFWRDSTGHEVDLVIERQPELFPIEIKSGKTITPAFFQNLRFWQKLTGKPQGAVIYAGDQIQRYSDGISVYPWNNWEEGVIPLRKSAE